MLSVEFTRNFYSISTSTLDLTLLPIPEVRLFGSVRESAVVGVRDSVGHAASRLPLEAVPGDRHFHSRSARVSSVLLGFVPFYLATRKTV